VGFDVGLLVGSGVVIVGLRVGSGVGLRVGLGVGLRVGSGVGLRDGRNVGSGVGRRVVGCDVGSFVGTMGAFVVGMGVARNDDIIDDAGFFEVVVAVVVEGGFVSTNLSEIGCGCCFCGYDVVGDDDDEGNLVVGDFVVGVRVVGRAEGEEEEVGCSSSSSTRSTRSANSNVSAEIVTSLKTG